MKIKILLYCWPLIFHSEWIRRYAALFIPDCKQVHKIFSEYNQQDATFHNLFISVRRCTCFRRFFRPSSGAQNCTYSIKHLSDRYCYLLLACKLADALHVSDGFSIHRQELKTAHTASDQYCYLPLACR